VALEIGDVVLVGDILIDLEAMKMHTHIISEVDGPDFRTCWWNQAIMWMSAIPSSLSM